MADKPMPTRRSKADKHQADKLPKEAMNATAPVSESPAPESRRIDPNVVISMVSLLFTAIALFFSAESTRISAQTASDSRDISKRQLRAYVYLDPETTINTSLDSSTRQKAELVFKNFGQTPAINVRQDGWITIEPPGSNPDLFPRPPVVGELMTNLYQGYTTRILAESARPFDEKELAGLFTGELRRYIYGYVEYDDVFGEHHRTKFCYASLEPGYALKANVTICENSAT